MSKNTVVLGLSGGVDSAVAGYLLKKDGYDVIGVFMKNWEEKDENGRCTSDTDFQDARSVAASLDIPFYSVNFAKEYNDRVFSLFLDEYKKGRTPNPDVLCNSEIKFKAFLDYAVKIGADYLATGHYARTKRQGGLTYLCRSKDDNKDQTYFLNQLSQSQIEKALFPLNDVEKSEVRQIAKELKLPVATKKDSTGICFIGERNFRNFLKTYLPSTEGEIKTVDGKIVGRHIGLMYYTIGQRRGLNIGGVKGSENGRWFVLYKDLATNTLYVSCKDESLLYSSFCSLNNINFIAKRPSEDTFKATAKFRYRETDVPVTVTLNGNGAKITCEEEERALTEGQYAVLYDGEICLGGGIIDYVDNSKVLELIK